MIQGNTDVQVCNWHMHTSTDVWETVTKELILVKKGATLEIVLLVFYCIYWSIYNFKCFYCFSIVPKYNIVFMTWFMGASKP